VSSETNLTMNRAELIIQLIKVALGLAFGAYFLWWSLEVLNSPAARTTEDFLVWQ
jgi:hypothetical protein